MWLLALGLPHVACLWLGLPRSMAVGLQQWLSESCFASHPRKSHVALSPESQAQADTQVGAQNPSSQTEAGQRRRKSV